MDEREEILAFLMDIVGEEGCGVTCRDAEVFKDEQGWKMMLEGFMGALVFGKDG